MTANNVFDLILQQMDNGSLQLAVKNISSGEQLFLHTIIQHSELVLVDKSGKHVTAFDNRTIQKFDNTTYKEDYLTLPANSTSAVFETTIKKADGNFSILWGPFVYKKLEPGKYQAHAQWESKIDSWADSETKERGSFSLVWKGTVKSNSIELTIK